MRFFALASALLAVPATAVIRDGSSSGNLNHPQRELLKRGITSDASQVNGKAFNFVVVGGGLAGLAIAARLAEWPNVTVAVIEAGPDGSEVQERIDVPGMSYGRGLSGTKDYDWMYQTVVQNSAGAEQKKWPRGKVLGGSGAINGMFWGRAAQSEYDAWAELNPGTNTTWDWEEMRKYINKAETFQQPSASNKETFHIPATSSYHGDSGPIMAGFCDYIFPFTSNWVPTWEALNLRALDLAGGTTRGVTITPSTLDMNGQKRSDSKAGYITGKESDNLVILTGQQATEILFNGTTDAAGNMIASGVSFSPYQGAETFTVQADYEVILAGGVVGSPQLLQLSGIGPKAVLEAANVEVRKDLPVGYNLQDHLSYTLYFNTQQIENWGDFFGNDAEMSSELTKWRESGTGKWTYVNEAVGYVSLEDIAGTDRSSFASAVNVEQIVSDIATGSNLPQSVRSGLSSQLQIQKNWLNTDVGQFEVILQMWGRGSNNIGIQVALQHPFARGTIFINSASAFDAPSIDPGYFNTQQDVDLMVMGTEWVRKLASTAPMGNIITGESQQNAGLTGNALVDHFKAEIGTEFHPLGTCSMLPEDQGGVVNTELLVYGTSNIRVVDSSIMPLQISAHLMATTYGIAEKAADLVKAKWEYKPPPVVNTTANSTTSSAPPPPPPSTASIGEATQSSVADAKKPADNKGLSSGAKTGIGIGVGVGVGLLLALLAFCLCARRNKSKRAADEKGWYSAGPGGDGGAWDTQAAYRDVDAFPMGSMAAGGAAGAGLGRPGRPFSAAPSVDTMATAELTHNDYQIGDYQRGGASSPYRDMDDSPYSTPQFQQQGNFPEQQHYTRVQPR